MTEGGKTKRAVLETVLGLSLFYSLITCAEM